VDLLIGDPTKAHQKLGWRHSTSFQELVTEMVQSDLKVIETEASYRRHHSGE
jgi:GDPmannose 4,6-dehydratase